jgi:hypothetical protein
MVRDRMVPPSVVLNCTTASVTVRRVTGRVTAGGGRG